MSQSLATMGLFSKLFRSTKKSTHAPSKKECKDESSPSVFAAAPPEQPKSRNLQVVEQYLKDINGHTLENNIHCRLDTKVHFEQFSCDLALFYDLTKGMFKSFSDFKLRVDSMTETETGAVICHVVSCGHHDKAPLSPPPGKVDLPPIPASGKYVENDPSELRCIIKNGRLVEMHVRALGKYSGPTGLYTLLEQAQKKGTKAAKKKNKKAQTEATA